MSPSVVTRDAMAPREEASTAPAAPHAMPFRCIHCLAPNPHLYRYLVPDGRGRRGGVSDVKLSACTRCRRVVDPYCEREPLLVALDLALLRRDAYRHALWNASEGRDAGAVECIATVVLSGALEALVRMDTAPWHRGSCGGPFMDPDPDADPTTAESLGHFARELAGGTLQSLAQFAVLIVPSYLLLSHQLSRICPHDLLPKLVLAWVLPTSFYLLMLFLRTWDTDDLAIGGASPLTAGRPMARLLVTLYQGLAVRAVVDGYLWHEGSGGFKQKMVRISVISIAVGCRLLLLLTAEGVESPLNVA